ncbi:hypothetical protein QZJ86_12070 [Methylomonas montana]|uniref:hypothetical protein n=1 Tax=Methylomonas montana TaxID=3058963 RepID=UPI002657C7DD|nr:hypothetical protein [Methylomonas montana]WKJ88758.1 hypothetical protein QZJ86_12070 [Methylomonas montana]
MTTKLGINWQERETKLCAFVLAGMALSVLAPNHAQNIQQAVGWGAGFLGLLTHTSGSR